MFSPRTQLPERPWKRAGITIEDAKGELVLHLGGSCDNAGRQYQGEYLSRLADLIVMGVNELPAEVVQSAFKCGKKFGDDEWGHLFVCGKDKGHSDGTCSAEVSSEPGKTGSVTWPTCISNPE